MIITIGVVLLLCAWGVYWALSEGYIGGDSTPQELIIAALMVALAAAGLIVLFAGLILVFDAH